MYILIFLLAAPAFAVVNGHMPDRDDPIRAVTLNIDMRLRQGQAGCTGTLISDRWVLTAGHCIEGVFGGRVKRPDGQIARIKNFYAMPKGAGAASFPSDVALIELQTPLKPPYAQLADASAMPKSNQSVFLAGYGDSSEKSDDFGTLRKVGLKLENPHYNAAEVLLEGHNKGACHGDSGGPAYTLADNAVTVFGVCVGPPRNLRHPICGQGSVYGSVAIARRWILAKTGLKPPANAPAPALAPAAAITASAVAVAAPPATVTEKVSAMPACVTDFKCENLEATEKQERIAEFYRDRRAEANVCVSGGIFSSYRGGIKKPGNCEIVKDGNGAHCAAGQALCSPILFCVGDGAPRCLNYGEPHGLAITANCETDFNNRIHAGGQECDPTIKDKAFLEHWNEVRAHVQKMFTSTCVENKAAGALFCSQCRRIHRRLAKMNHMRLKTECPQGSVKPAVVQAKHTPEPLTTE